jgi:ubiquinone/menaquinone biosynthesis C-methylase UbiE
MRVERVRARYRRIAPFYDRLVRSRTEAVRREAVRRLELREGARVLDLGCGTGLSLASGRIPRLGHEAPDGERRVDLQRRPG